MPDDLWCCGFGYFCVCKSVVLSTFGEGDLGTAVFGAYCLSVKGDLGAGVVDACWVLCLSWISSLVVDLSLLEARCGEVLVRIGTLGIELLGSGAGWLYSNPGRCALLMGTSSCVSFTISTSPTLLGAVATSPTDPFTSSRYHPSGISNPLCFNGTEKLLPGAAFHGAIFIYPTLHIPSLLHTTLEGSTKYVHCSYI